MAILLIMQCSIHTSPIQILAGIGIDFCYYWVHRAAHGISLISLRKAAKKVTKRSKALVAGPLKKDFFLLLLVYNNNLWLVLNGVVQYNIMSLTTLFASILETGCPISIVHFVFRVSIQK